jgi:hypothetical protein
MITIERVKKIIKKAILNTKNVFSSDFILGKLEYEIVRKKKGYHSVLDYYGRSSKKQADIRFLPEFGTLAATVIQQGRTLLYYDRLFTIYQVLRNFKSYSGKLNFAEIGVYRGGSSYFTALSAKNLGIGDVTLYCFDTFEGHSALDVRSEKDASHYPRLFGDAEYVDVKKYLEEFDNVIVLKGRFQDTCSQVENKKFHFVHLDVDIYDPTIFALNFFDKYLDSGAVIIVDDYGFQTCPGIRTAVEEFLSANPNYLRLELLTGQCILIKKN